MKRLLPLLLFLLLCCVVQASARMNAYIAGSAASATSCTTEIPSSSNTRLSASADTPYAVGSDSGRYYLGQIIRSSGAKTICKVAWRTHSSHTGDVSSLTLYSQIWTVNGANDYLDTLVEESATTYTNPATSTTLEFVHSASVNADYAIVVTTKNTDGSNYVQVGGFMSDKDNGYSDYARWQSDKVLGVTNASYDVKGQFYE